MDKHTFRRFRDRCGEGKRSAVVNLDLLEVPERALHTILKRKNLRLEQEKIPQEYVNAYVFFMAGYIESWGRGIEIMLEGCKEYKIPEPVILEEQGGLSVTFLKDIYTAEYLQTLNLNERQIKGILHAKEKGSIKNAEYQEINNLGKTVAAEELQELTNKGILQKVGTTGRSTKYILIEKGNNVR